MSEHSSINSNADMEVINAEDLEDSPPPGDEKGIDETISTETNSAETKDLPETQEKVVEATASGDTETIGEIQEVSTTTEENVSKIETTVDDDDDPPIEILEAPTPPLSQAASSEPEPVATISPNAEVSEPTAAADPEPIVPNPDVDAPAPAVAPVPAAAPKPAPAPEPAAAPSPAPAPQPVSVRPAVTAERPAATLEEVDDDEEDDDDIDETLTERLIGLTEMFPDFVRNGSVSLVKGSWTLAQSFYSLTRAASWVVFSSATILFMPVMIESERLQLQDQQKAQKNQILLGPGAAVSGGPALGPPPI